MNIKFFKKLDDNKYRLTKSPYLNKKHKFFVSLAKQYDKYGYMSKELGGEIERLFEDSSYIVGIHRTGYSPVNEEFLNEIFNRGLINNMDLFQGVDSTNSDYLDIEKTVTLFDNPIILNGQLKVAHNYKASAGSIIIKIPKSYLGIQEGEVKPIYYKDGMATKLLPEFIYGYVPVDNNGVLGEIVHNPNYTDHHIYIDPEDTLLYETRAINMTQRRK